MSKMEAINENGFLWMENQSKNDNPHLPQTEYFSFPHPKERSQVGAQTKDLGL